jgi:DNA-binding CsgD family transcriptional regulator
MMATRQTAKQILEAEVRSNGGTLDEASVRLSPRGHLYIATFSGPEPGQQIARSTGLTDRAAALALAKQWERQARRERERRKAEREHAPSRIMSPGLSQREVAAMMRVSERGVRAIEKRAIAKLKRHPALREFWGEYNESQSSTGLVADMESWARSAEEAAALLELARSPLELQVLRRVLAIVR